MRTVTLEMYLETVPVKGSKFPGAILTCDQNRPVRKDKRNVATCWELNEIEIPEALNNPNESRHTNYNTQREAPAVIYSNLTQSYRAWIA